MVAAATEHAAIDLGMWQVCGELPFELSGQDLKPDQYVDHRPADGDGLSERMQRLVLGVRCGRVR